MKCWVHPKEDAVAVCKSCGKGVCQNCAISISGDLYCKSCVESGRIVIRPPTAPIEAEPMPSPKGVPIRALFIIGGVGSVLTTIATIPLTLVFFATFLVMPQTTFQYYRPFFGGEASIPVMVSVLVFAFIAIIFSAIGYLGSYKNYGSGSGAAGFAFGIVVPVMLMVYAVGIVAFLTSEYWYYYYYHYNEIARAFLIIAFIVTCILFGIMLILWGVTHIGTRRFTGHSGLSTATGIMLIISGALMLSTVLSFVALGLLFIAEILATILFFISDIPKVAAKS